MHDEKGSIKEVFSRSVGLKYSNDTEVTELMVIRESLKIFRWSSGLLIMKSDSTNDIHWVSEERDSWE